MISSIFRMCLNIMILHLPCGHPAKHHSEKQTFTCLLLLSRPCTADWLRLHLCLSYFQPLISRLCLVLSDSLHFCTDVCQRSARLCFSSGAETACGSVTICWPKTNKLPHRDTFPLCYAAVNAKCVFLIETIPALPGAASAGPSPSFCFSPKLPSRKMAASALLEVQRQIKLVGELTSKAFNWLNAKFSVSGVFAQSAITWPSRLCAQRAAWYEEYSPIMDSMR